MMCTPNMPNSVIFKDIYSFMKEWQLMHTLISKDKIKSILLEMKTGGGMDNDFEVALFNQMFI